MNERQIAATDAAIEFDQVTFRHAGGAAILDVPVADLAAPYHATLPAAMDAPVAVA